MKLTHGIEINENIITVNIAVTELGDATRDASTELNQLHNFVREIEYSKIDFTGNMKIVNNQPVVTAESPDGSEIEEIKILDIINKKFVIDESLSISQTFDITRMAKSAYEDNAVFNNAELLGQAYAVLFTEKVLNAISEKLSEIRALANDIEQETDVVL